MARRWWAVPPGGNSLEQSENMPEERERRGDDDWDHSIYAPSPDAESIAENLQNTYAAMPEERQRRFWVRFFIGHPIKGKMICLKFI